MMSSKIIKKMVLVVKLWNSLSWCDVNLMVYMALESDRTKARKENQLKATKAKYIVQDNLCNATFLI